MQEAPGFSKAKAKHGTKINLSILRHKENSREETARNESHREMSIAPSRPGGQGWLRERFHESNEETRQHWVEWRASRKWGDTVFKAPGTGNYSSSKVDGRLACQLLELRGAAMWVCVTWTFGNNPAERDTWLWGKLDAEERTKALRQHLDWAWRMGR